MRILSFAVELFRHIYEKSNKIYVHKNLSELRQFAKHYKNSSRMLQKCIKARQICYI